MDSTEKNSQTQAPKKEWPDCLKVLIVPIVLAVVGGFITYMNNQAQQIITDEKRQDDVLSKYILEMKEFSPDGKPPDKTSSLPPIARALNYDRIKSTH